MAFEKTVSRRNIRIMYSVKLILAYILKRLPPTLIKHRRQPDLFLNSGRNLHKQFYYSVTPVLNIEISRKLFFSLLTHSPLATSIM